MRHDFYMMAFRRMGILTTISLSVAVVSMITSSIMIAFAPSPVNYAMTPDGRIMAMTPLSDGVSQSVVTNFAATSLSSAFSFDFNNYNIQLGNAKTLFTEDGYNKYVEAIRPLVEEAKQNYFVSTAVIMSAPVIVKSAMVDGIMKYKVSTVVLIDMIGQTKKALPRKWILEVVIERVPQTKYPLGIAISRITAQQAK